MVEETVCSKERQVLRLAALLKWLLLSTLKQLGEIARIKKGKPVSPSQ